MRDVTVSGTWYVVRTTLPFWRTRQNPSVTYAPLPDGRVADTVRYTRRGGGVRLVHGVDEPCGDGDWRWRGVTPLTRLTSSRWRVLDATDEWAVTHFDRTLFTPEGWDVYARTASLSGKQETSARIVLDGVARLPELFAPRHGFG